MSAARRRRPLTRREAVFAAAAALAVLAAAEVFLRLVPVGRKPYDDVFDNVHDVFFAMVPGAINPWGQLHDQLNAFGFRGEGHARAKPPGTFRVVCLGDSCTFGFRAAAQDAYPARLQKLFDARGGTPRVEVINGGVPGTVLFQQVHLLREKLLPFAPDLVIDWSAPNWVQSVKRYRDRMKDPPFYVALQRPLRRLALYRWLVGRFRPAPREKAYYELLNVDPQGPGKTPVADYLDDYRQDLEELRRLSLDRGFALIFTNYPRLQNILVRDIDPPRDGSFHFATLQAFCRAYGYPLVDLIGPQRPGADQSLWMDDVHPSGKGAQIIAKTLYDAIEAGGYLRPARAMPEGRP